ncbi:hypothetical protein BDR06DRAFT_1002423 [Suillus hirtellus]|nr:hypothetical protein BDR06DRAFT_1002423 [Suillus hirtellus]
MSTSEEQNASRSGSDTSAAQQAEVFMRPKGWRRIDYHPITQVCLMGFVCCMRPGIFNALSGLGAGGRVMQLPTQNAIAAYSSSVRKDLRPWHTPPKLRSRRSSVIPGESSTVGCVVARDKLLLDADQVLMIDLIVLTQIGFLIPTLIGVLWLIFLVDPYKMIRTDRCVYQSFCGPEDVPLGHLSMLLPMLCFSGASNAILSVSQTSHGNNAAGRCALIIIRPRGRSSKNRVYWTAQVFGSFFIDASVTLKWACAFLCWSIVVVFVYLSILLPKSSSEPAAVVKIDINDPDYPAHVWLVIFYSFLDSIWQTTTG